MSFTDVQNKTILTGFSAADEATILAAMRTAYEGSATAKKMFDDWISVPTNMIAINFLSGAFGAYPNQGRLVLDLNELTQAMYIDNDGTAVKDTAVTAIVHELVHALTGRLDNKDLIFSGVTNDYRQPTVTFSNIIYRELGLPEQNSYIAYDQEGNILTPNLQYTNGVAIDRAVVRDIDWDSSKWGNSKDLLIGGASGNTLRSGDGNDFLYGNGGNDTLDGGTGNDMLVGGERADTYVFQTGDGFDTILDSDGVGSIVYDGETLTGGAQYGDNRVYRSADGKHLYVQVDANSLVVDGNILINNYTAGDLNIIRTGTSAGSTPPALTNQISLVELTASEKIIRDRPEYSTYQRWHLGNQYDDGTYKRVYEHKTIPGSYLYGEGITDPDYAPAFDSRGDPIYASMARLGFLTAASDRLIGSTGDDRIGHFGAVDAGLGDRIEAGAGHDEVFGGKGDDVISGGADSDILSSNFNKYGYVLS